MQLILFRRRFQSILINLSLFAAFYYVLFADDDEEDAPGQNESSTREVELVQTKVGHEAAEGEDECSNEDGTDVQLPDTIPEDAYFIPLGFPRQRPQIFYRGSDPEWQSFLEFSRDRKRALAIRSKPYFGKSSKLAGLTSS